MWQICGCSFSVKSYRYLHAIVLDFYFRLWREISQEYNKSTASGAIYARSSVIFPHRMAIVRGGEVDAVKKGPKLNMIKIWRKTGGVTLQL